MDAMRGEQHVNEVMLESERCDRPAGQPSSLLTTSSGISAGPSPRLDARDVSGGQRIHPSPPAQPPGCQEPHAHVDRVFSNRFRRLQGALQPDPVLFPGCNGQIQKPSSSSSIAGSPQDHYVIASQEPRDDPVQPFASVSLPEGVHHQAHPEPGSALQLALQQQRDGHVQGQAGPPMRHAEGAGPQQSVPPGAELQRLPHQLHSVQQQQQQQQVRGREDEAASQRQRNFSEGAGGHASLEAAAAAAVAAGSRSGPTTRMPPTQHQPPQHPQTQPPSPAQQQQQELPQALDASLQQLLPQATLGPPPPLPGLQLSLSGPGPSPAAAASEALGMGPGLTSFGPADRAAMEAHVRARLGLQPRRSHGHALPGGDGGGSSLLGPGGRGLQLRPSPAPPPRPLTESPLAGGESRPGPVSVAAAPASPGFAAATQHGAGGMGMGPLGPGWRPDELLSGPGGPGGLSGLGGASGAGTGMGTGLCRPNDALMRSSPAILQSAYPPQPAAGPHPALHQQHPHPLQQQQQQQPLHQQLQQPLHQQLQQPLHRRHVVLHHHPQQQPLPHRLAVGCPPGGSASGFASEPAGFGAGSGMAGTLGITGTSGGLVVGPGGALLRGSAPSLPLQLPGPQQGPMGLQGPQPGQLGLQGPQPGPQGLQLGPPQGLQARQGPHLGLQGQLGPQELRSQLELQGLQLPGPQGLFRGGQLAPQQGPMGLQGPGLQGPGPQLGLPRGGQLERAGSAPQAAAEGLGLGQQALAETQAAAAAARLRRLEQLGISPSQAANVLAGRAASPSLSCGSAPHSAPHPSPLQPALCRDERTASGGGAGAGNSNGGVGIGGMGGSFDVSSLQPGQLGAQALLRPGSASGSPLAVGGGGGRSFKRSISDRRWEEQIQSSHPAQHNQQQLQQQQLMLQRAAQQGGHELSQLQGPPAGLAPGPMPLSLPMQTHGSSPYPSFQPGNGASGSRLRHVGGPPPSLLLRPDGPGLGAGAGHRPDGPLGQSSADPLPGVVAGFAPGTGAGLEDLHALKRRAFAAEAQQQQQQPLPSGGGGGAFGHGGGMGVGTGMRAGSGGGGVWVGGGRASASQLGGIHQQQSGGGGAAPPWAFRSMPDDIRAAIAADAEAFGPPRLPAGLGLGGGPQWVGGPVGMPLPPRTPALGAGAAVGGLGDGPMGQYALGPAPGDFAVVGGGGNGMGPGGPASGGYPLPGMPLGQGMNLGHSVPMDTAAGGGGFASNTNTNMGRLSGGLGGGGSGGNGGLRRGVSDAAMELCAELASGDQDYISDNELQSFIQELCEPPPNACSGPELNPGPAPGAGGAADGQRVSAVGRGPSGGGAGGGGRGARRPSLPGLALDDAEQGLMNAEADALLDFQFGP